MASAAIRNKITHFTHAAVEEIKDNSETHESLHQPLVDKQNALAATCCASFVRDQGAISSNPITVEGWPHLSWGAVMRMRLHEAFYATI